MSYFNCKKIGKSLVFFKVVYSTEPQLGDFTQIMINVILYIIIGANNSSNNISYIMNKYSYYDVQFRAFFVYVTCNLE